jgi:hypothetical protein
VQNPSNGTNAPLTLLAVWRYNSPMFEETRAAALSRKKMGRDQEQKSRHQRYAEGVRIESGRRKGK